MSYNKNFLKLEKSPMIYFLLWVSILILVLQISGCGLRRENCGFLEVSQPTIRQDKVSS